MVKVRVIRRNWSQGTQKMVRENECSSYQMFELTSGFYKEVLGNGQGTRGNSSR